MTSMEKPQDAAVARPLTVLVPLIQADLKQGREAEERAGLPYIGRLAKSCWAKSQIPHR
jgi:hypothetical protein